MTCSSRSGGRESLFFTKAVPADLTRTVANDKQRNIRKKRKERREHTDFRINDLGWCGREVGREFHGDDLT